VKLPPPTTVSTVPPYRRLTAVKAITATVLQNVRRLTATTAGTGTTTAVLTAASPIGATVLQNARPVMPTTAGTKRRFRCRPTPTARPTTPTAPPNVPPGAVTQVITNPEIHASWLANLKSVKQDVLMVQNLAQMVVEGQEIVVKRYVRLNLVTLDVMMILPVRAGKGVLDGILAGAVMIADISNQILGYDLLAQEEHIVIAPEGFRFDY